VTPTRRPPRRSLGRRATATLLLLAAALGCHRAPPPNVLLVTFDTTRWDHLGFAGDPEARTPTLDALAARGLVFDHAYASVALTLPSHTTIMTGLEPLAHGVHNNGRFVVPAGVETLAERLGAAGWDTAAFVSAFVLAARFGLDQGFGVYDDETHRPTGTLDLSVPERRGAETTDAALGWLAGRPTATPFFLWVHYYDPHLPRTVEPPFDAMGNPYDAEIAYADAQLGRLLAGVAEHAGARETLIVFTADHGEGLAEHGERTHGILAYDSTLHVPLVLAGPGVPHGARRDAFARHVDIVPTVLAAVGLGAPAGLPGRDLLRESPAADDAVGFFESRGPEVDLGWAPLDGVRTARWKYTARPEPRELYDVRADPGELRNRIDDAPEARAAMEALYAKLQRETPRAEATAGQLDLDERERLAALGYVEAPQARAPGEEPDPRRFASIRDTVDDARELASMGDYDRAIEALETLAQGPTVRTLVLRTLAMVYVERGRYDDAVAAYREYLQVTGAEEAHVGLARTLVQAGRPAEALAALDAVAAPSRGTQLVRAHALARLGRHAEARATIDAAFADRPGSTERLRKRAALAIDSAPLADGEAELRALLAAAPDDAILRSWLGYYLAVWGRPGQADEAYALLAAAAAAAPRDAEVQANLGWGAWKLGRVAEARAPLETALALEPGSALDRFRLALVLERSGERARAATLVRSALAQQPAASWAEAANALLRRLEPTAPGTQTRRSAG
jgi:arylsulfatase A-like enzyme/Tfp pilus assembly protein PilF